ncbi:PQQ-binding-like beta-propeller repeat protein [Corallococcus sp. 4LFB]|uniref:outer membrane protein assembly factor BamB family protein n=1 Tax=Corallococcus sp. 4LFB TaxID=3383249 RepID=UPI003974EA95
MTLAVMACQRAPVQPAFQYSSDASSRTGLTALADGVLLGNEAGAVVRLDREGRPVWTTRLGREVAVAPVLAGDSVIVGTVVGELACLSLQDGKERWRLGGEPPVLTPPWWTTRGAPSSWWRPTARCTPWRWTPDRRAGSGQPPGLLRRLRRRRLRYPLR